MEILDECGIEEKPRVIGVTRSYAVRHGNGPFPTYDENLTDILKEDYNNSDGYQGRFRCGYLDFPLLDYAIRANHGVDLLAITHVDKLPLRDEWNMCDYYNKKILDKLPESIDEQEMLTKNLFLATPIYSRSHYTSITDIIEYNLNVPTCLLSYGASRKDKVLYL